MDCRRALWLVGVGVGCLGCSHQVATMPSVSPTATVTASASPVEPIPENRIKKEGDLPPRAPHAKTCVAGGDFFAREAVGSDVSDMKRQELFDKARKAYQQAIAIDPHYKPAYESLATLYVAMKDHSHAVATYHKALKVFPNDAGLYFALGKCRVGAKEWDAAVKALTKATDLDPENREYVNTLGVVLARAGRLEESLACFQRVNPEAEAHYRLALTLKFLNQTEEAKQHLQAAVDKEPDLEKAQALLAKLEGRPVAADAPVEQTNYAEPAAPAAPPVSVPAAVEAGPVPAAKPVLLPPPPRIPFKYKGDSAIEAHSPPEKVSGE